MASDIPAIQPIVRAWSGPVYIPPAPLGGYTRKPHHDKMPPPDKSKRSIDNSYRRARKTNTPAVVTEGSREGVSER